MAHYINKLLLLIAILLFLSSDIFAQVCRNESNNYRIAYCDSCSTVTETYLTSMTALCDGSRDLFWPIRTSKVCTKYFMRTRSRRGCFNIPAVCGVKKQVLNPRAQTDNLNKLKNGADPFIVGGYQATRGMIPWQVRLDLRGNGGSYLCGGSILNSHWILTAAHCLYGLSVSSSKVIVGDHRQSVKEPSEVVHNISLMVSHALYVGGYSVSNYDIALIKTVEEIKFNDYVQPVCLPDEPQSYVGKQAMISGWGYTNDISAGTSSDVLKYAFATVVDDSQCSSGYVNRLCLRGISSSSACYGDSGGPFLIEKYGRMEQIGITWFGMGGCPTTSAFSYTDVSAYLNWIRPLVFN